MEGIDILMSRFGLDLETALNIMNVIELAGGSVQEFTNSLEV